MMTEPGDIDELREKRLQELKENHSQESSQGDQAEAEKRKQDQEAKKKQILRQALTEDARKRLNNVRMVDEDKATKVEQSVIQIAQSGRLKGEIDDAKMKEILNEISDDSPDYNIRGMSSRRNKD